jgi:hypothetical protein
MIHERSPMSPARLANIKGLLALVVDEVGSDWRTVTDPLEPNDKLILTAGSNDPWTGLDHLPICQTFHSPHVVEFLRTSASVQAELLAEVERLRAALGERQEAAA